MSAKNFIRPNFNTITPYLIIKGATQALAFYQKAFAAKEIMHLAMPDGRIGYASIEIAGTRVMLCDEFPEMDFYSPISLKNTSVMMYMYVEDVDAFVETALKAGATLMRSVTDQFFGDRAGVIQDPFGHIWHIATHIEDVSPDEIKKRFAAMMNQHQTS